jgi:hypothetical protein
MIPKKYSEKHELEEYVIEYSAKTMIYRLSVVFIVLLFIIFGVNMISNYYKEENRVIPENFVEEYDSNLKELYVVEEKSYGDFKSLDDNILVQGNLEVKLDGGKQYVYFYNFKITKNANLKPALSTNIAGRSVIFLADRLLGTVGDQSYQIPENVDLNEHRYFVLWDTAKNKPISYAELK